MKLAKELIHIILLGRLYHSETALYRKLHWPVDKERIGISSIFLFLVLQLCTSDLFRDKRDTSPHAKTKTRKALKSSSGEKFKFALSVLLRTRSAHRLSSQHFAAVSGASAFCFFLSSTMVFAAV